jgi:hypothetical protein
MALPRPAKPTAFLADLRAFLGGQHRFKLLFGVLAVAMPLLILYGFNRDAHTNIMPGRQITYIQDWPADRSDAEIIAQQKIDQKAREAAEAEKRAAYQRLANQLGIK